MKILQTVPIDFYPSSTNPTQPLLFEAVQKFCEAEFGNRLELWRQAKVWVAVEDEEIVGITTMQMVPDIPTFHVTRGDDSEDARARARKARDMLTARLVCYTQDGAGTGKQVFVYIDPKVERFWKPYLRLIKAQPANRVIVLS